jgi:hypothetical protein
VKVLKRNQIATILLMLGTFFNPLGYDALLKLMIDLMGGYWNGIFIFYLLSVSCFISYFIVAKKNPLNIFKKK